MNSKAKVGVITGHWFSDTRPSTVTSCLCQDKQHTHEKIMKFIHHFLYVILVDLIFSTVPIFEAIFLFQLSVISVTHFETIIGPFGML